MESQHGHETSFYRGSSEFINHLENPKFFCESKTFLNIHLIEKKVEVGAFRQRLFIPLISWKETAVAAAAAAAETAAAAAKPFFLLLLLLFVEDRDQDLAITPRPQGKNRTSHK